VRVADAGLRGGYVFADGAHEVHLGALPRSTNITRQKSRGGRNCVLIRVLRFGNPFGILATVVL